MIALSLVFFAARYGWLYQTLALLVFAYVVRFLPQSVAATEQRSASWTRRSRMRRGGWVDATLACSSESRCRSRAPVSSSVAALVFLSVMKELPATLLLRPIGFETLATEIWQETNVAAYSDAAPPALLLILVSAPFVYLLAARRGSDVSAPG